MLRRIDRLWPAGLVFALFVLAALFMPELLAATGAEAMERGYQILGYTLQAGLWMSGAFLIVRLFNLYVWDRLIAGTLGTPVPRLLKDCVALIVYLVAAAGIVGVVFGQSVTGLWATSGAITIVLGLALRSIILDVFTGLALNVDRTYRIGDWIEVHDRERTIYGQVVEINWRTTRLDLTDGRTTVIPNSRMGTTIVTNFSLPDGTCRFELPVALDFSVPQERAIRVLFAGALEACSKERGLLDRPEPRVIVHGPTAIGVEYRVRYWVRVADVNPPVARDAISRSILHHLERAGLALAYPKNDVFHAPMPVRQLEHHAEADRAKLLAGIDILAHALTPEERRQVAHEMTPRLYPAGAAVLRAGEAGGSMLVLAEGLFEVSTVNALERLRLALVTPGQFVGEMSLLTGEPRSADVTAVTESLVYEITREHLMPILEARPELFEAISHIVAERRLRTSKRLAESAAAPASAAETRGAAAQLGRKMRLFFGRVFERPVASGGE